MAGLVAFVKAVCRRFNRPMYPWQGDSWQIDLDRVHPWCVCEWALYHPDGGWYRARRVWDCPVHRGR